LIHDAIQHRSGRAIALARVVLAAVFLVAIWADPSQPSRYPREAYLILTGYVLLSGSYLVATWNDWWREHCWARLAHMVDIVLFGVMVYLTDGYTSPFFTFFVFIILSALIKWGWRETAAASVAVILLFVAAGFAATSWQEAQVEQVRLTVRGTYLVVLSLVLIWFAASQQSRYRRQSIEFSLAPVAGGPPIDAGLRLVAERTGAGRVVLLWWEEEEPWLHTAMLRDGNVTEQKQRPDRFGAMVNPQLSGAAFLFDAAAGHVLVGHASGQPEALHVPDPVDPELVTAIEACSGLVFPVESDAYSGIFIVLDVPGLCSDDLEMAERLGREFSAVLQRSAVLAVSEQAAENRVRLGVARDLHDSVAQLLAGTALRIEGLRKSLALGRPIEADLSSLQEELAGEQRELRALIAQLRGRPRRIRTVSLAETLSSTLSRAARQWTIACILEHCPPGLQVASALQHELSLLVKEGVANAVRHGNATEVRISVDVGGAEISLAIRDNGKGFPVERSSGGGMQPWSLNERVHELGGTLMLASGPNGSEITVSLPWEEAE
jgi:signal transduction histidine kinase